MLRILAIASFTGVLGLCAAAYVTTIAGPGGEDQAFYAFFDGPAVYRSAASGGAFGFVVGLLVGFTSLHGKRTRAGRIE